MKVLIVKRDDLSINGKKLPINMVELRHVVMTREKINKAEIVIYIDEAGNVKTLKNRWGRTKIIIRGSRLKKIRAALMGVTIGVCLGALNGPNFGFPLFIGVFTLFGLVIYILDENN